MGHHGGSSLAVVGKGGLMSESSLEEAVGGGGLSGALNLWMASLGIGILSRWGLVITAAGNVGVSRRIWRLNLRIFLSGASICWGFGGIN